MIHRLFRSEAPTAVDRAEPLLMGTPGFPSWCHTHRTWQAQCSCEQRTGPLQSDANDSDIAAGQWPASVGKERLVDRVKVSRDADDEAQSRSISAISSTHLLSRCFTEGSERIPRERQRSCEKKSHSCRFCLRALAGLRQSHPGVLSQRFEQ